ncbi:MAG: metallophosphoesterase [Lachnospiraceae bacterium]|nr:metallophosphoesterase [Lachnospiraceae bacterium]
MWWLLIPGAGIVFLLVILIRSSRERKMLENTCYEVPVRDLPEELSDTELLFLTDLHDEEFGEDNLKLLKALQEYPADAVLIGGDMLTVKENHSGDMRALRAVLEAFSGKLPVYYGLGNHETRMRENPEDYPGWYERFLALIREYNVILLDDSSAYLTKNGRSIRISGFTLDRKYYRKGHTEKLDVSAVTSALGPSRDMPEIVLLHSPMYGETLSAWGADLVLSGHFHGGTVRLPLLGGVMTPQLQFFSPLAKGRKEYGDTTEIVSGGLGTHSIRIRFMNKPDIVRVRLVRKEDK